ncbi:multiheme c-type cytochrome [Thermoproteota archaeon]
MINLYIDGSMAIVKLVKQSKMILITLLVLYMTLAFVNCSTIVNAESNEEYKGAGYCFECHPNEGKEWLQSAHTEAYSNDNFQDVWINLGSNDSCLECHTTGYDIETETYVYREVQCEVCHGPGDTMNRDTSPELCGECHTGPYPTYDEWIDSGPSHGTADCLTCHNEHTSKMEYETPTDTCGQCHESHVNQVEDTQHGENSVDCTDCHMIIEEADFYIGKQAKTGHSFNPTEQELDCTSCHDRELDKHDVLGEKSAACLSCHGDIHELRLELVNGETYENDNPVPLCAQCHNERYTAWEEGTHGAHDNPEAVCTECHDPHDPVINQISTLEPIPNREPAKPSSWIAKMALIVILEIFGFGVWINWSGK